MESGDSLVACLGEMPVGLLRYNSARTPAKRSQGVTDETIFRFLDLGPLSTVGEQINLGRNAPVWRLQY
jgi:hypothetical protein